MDIEEDQVISLDKSQDYFIFFKNFIGSMEVVNAAKQITKVYFQKPFYTKFLTVNIKRHLVIGSHPN